MTVLCTWLNGNALTAQVVDDAVSCTALNPQGFVSPLATDYVSLSTLGTLFQQYFAFDDVLFAEVVGWSLVSFSIGHGLGRLMQVWRKSF